MKKLVRVGNDVKLVERKVTQLDVLAVSADKKTVICGEPESGSLFTNDKETAMKFLKEDTEKGDVAAFMILLTAELIGGLKELPME